MKKSQPKLNPTAAQWRKSRAPNLIHVEVSGDNLWHLCEGLASELRCNTEIRYIDDVDDHDFAGIVAAWRKSYPHYVDHEDNREGESKAKAKATRAFYDDSADLLEQLIASLPSEKKPGSRIPQPMKVTIELPPEAETKVKALLGALEIPESEIQRYFQDVACEIGSDDCALWTGPYVYPDLETAKRVVRRLHDGVGLPQIGIVNLSYRRGGRTWTQQFIAPWIRREVTEDGVLRLKMPLEATKGGNLHLKRGGESARRHNGKTAA